MTNGSVSNSSPDPAPKNQVRCPNCARFGPIGDGCCVYCGVVYAKFRRRTRPPEKDLVTEAAASVPAPGPIGPSQLKRHAAFFHSLGRMLESGLPLVGALQQLTTLPAPLGPLARDLVPSLNRGQGLMPSLYALAPSWPCYVWAHLEAGDRSGHLATMCLRLGEEIQRRRTRLLQQVFNFRNIMLFVYFFLASLSVAISGAVRDLDPAKVDQGVGAVIDGIVTGMIPRFLGYGTMAVLAIAAFCWFQLRGKDLLTERSPAFERLRLTLPIFSGVLIRESLARYLDLLVTLVDSGLPITKCLTLAAGDIEFPRWRTQFHAVREVLERGGDLIDGFAQIDHIPPEVSVQLRTAMVTGEFGGTLQHQAAAMREEAVNFRNGLQAVYLALAFLVGIVLTVMALVAGMGAWIPLYEKVLGI
ncbi:Type II secretion system F family protein [Sulfidibacter corallicola]|uniref:Type II secretion system F family protein n=1 Tax=Sulfidibacter corallicola TaxID=2818388 RepID=A0A8A4U5I6_SULCO|nr:type II secretion system F family protein [Sulfidibacter corallicola]QTD54005.1 type II secretion system F family protein [Sulfidibacter corallicola]